MHREVRVKPGYPAVPNPEVVGLAQAVVDTLDSLSFRDGMEKLDMALCGLLESHGLQLVHEEGDWEIALIGGNPICRACFPRGMTEVELREIIGDAVSFHWREGCFLMVKVYPRCCLCGRVWDGSKMVGAAGPESLTVKMNEGMNSIDFVDRRLPREWGQCRVAFHLEVGSLLNAQELIVWLANESERGHRSKGEIVLELLRGVGRECT
jgi:hypothetical protein